MTIKAKTEKIVPLNDIHLKRKGPNIYEVTLKQEYSNDRNTESGTTEIIIPKVMIEFSNITGGFIATGKILA